MWQFWRDFCWVRCVSARRLRPLTFSLMAVLKPEISQAGPKKGIWGFTGVTTFPVHSGIYAACFGPMGSDGGIVQVLNTVVGQTYDLSFWLYNEGGTPNAVIVSWGGTVVFNESDLSSFPYTQFNYSTVATSTTTPLELEFRQDPAYFYLDDVSVTAVPEPTTLVNLSLLGGCGLAVNRWRKPKAA